MTPDSPTTRAGSTNPARSADSYATCLGSALDAISQAVFIHDRETGEPIFENSTARDLGLARHEEAGLMRAIEEAVADALGGRFKKHSFSTFGPPRRDFVIHTKPAGDSSAVVTVVEDLTVRNQLDAIRRDFVANVSHELRTPIGALGLLAETLAYEEDPAVRQRLANRIQNETFRVAKVIDDLLDLSRIESEGATHKEPTDLVELGHEVVEQMTSAADTARVELGFSVEGAGFVIEADRRQLRSAMANLVDNAIKYSDKDSWVRVGLRHTEDGRIEISVADHGIGIPQKDLERIFERFYRVDQARSRQTGGTGLGLSIVRHAVSNHNGIVEVESREGVGTTFRIILPSTGGEQA
ncbi:MAG: ATP-binding protein [Actinomycetota bacterium]|nr:ATP-binding protein [Actinomycetota bacterium]